MSLSVISRGLVAASILVFLLALGSSTALGDPGPVPDPTAPLTPTKDYQPVDPPITAQQFQADIATVNASSTRPISWSRFSWNVTASAPGPAGALPAAQSTVTGIAGQVPTGHVNLDANNVPPTPGSSILGVPHAQTLYYATILAGKNVNGTEQDAICYFEIFSGTPQATRYIKYGVAFSCNQPWIHGAIAAGLGGINYPSGTTIDEHPLGTTNAPEVENGFVYYGLVSATAYYSRSFEQQLENIYGYLDLYIDNPGSNDNFLGQPGGSGAYDSYNCAGANTPHVICQIVTGPFTFTPTDDTQCTTGDACGSATGNTPGQLEDAYDGAAEQGADQVANNTPVEPVPSTSGDDGIDAPGSGTQTQQAANGDIIESYDTGTQADTVGSDPVNGAYAAAVCGNEASRCSRNCYSRITGMARLANSPFGTRRLWSNVVEIHWCAAKNDPAYKNGRITSHNLTCHRATGSGWGHLAESQSDKPLSVSKGQAICAAIFEADPLGADAQAAADSTKVGVDYSADGTSRRSIYQYKSIK